jgi:hypothetical protein
VKEGKMNLGEQVEQTPSVFEKLLAPLLSLIREEEAQLPEDPQEKMSLSNFIPVMIYGILKGYLGLRRIEKGVESAPPELLLPKAPKSTLADAFTRFSPLSFQRLFRTLLHSITLLSVPEMNDLGRLCCVDGSFFPALATMLWAQWKENVHAVKLHLAFELNRMIPVEFLLTEGNANEKKVLLNMAQAGVTYILDRGYFAFYLLQDLIAKGAFFILRTREDLRYTIVSTLPTTVPPSVRHLFAHLTDQLVRCPNDPSRSSYRLITFVCRNTPFLILTNRTDLTTFQIILLYAYRWQIELLFRFLKRSMGGLHLFNLSQEGLAIQFYLFLITAILELNLKQEATKTMEEHRQNSASEETQPDLSQKVPPSTLEQKENTCASPVTFLHTIGEKLHTYWKLSIYWRDTLRDLLTRPWDRQAVFLLGST